MDDRLCDLLACELGEVRSWEEECPGVYYFNVLPANGTCGEYYVILETALISQDVRAMGKQLYNTPALVYPMESDDGARWAVEYEILRYKASHGLPLPAGTSLQETALYGMEHCPDYFGTYPVPPVTPWGYTLRHRPLDNGIYWLETDQCIEGLAVCHPVWVTELSEGLLGIAERLEHEGEMGYCYFQRRTACVAIFELLRSRSALASTGLIRRSELMNAIWAYHPEYAMGYNAQEQAGLGNALGQLLYMLGAEDREMESSPEHMITMTPEAGTDFIGFWK